MSKYTAHNDPALGSFIRFVERVALSTRLNYIKRSRLVFDHEYATDTPPDVSDSDDLVEHLPWGLDELSDNLSLCTAICRLTTMERRVLVLSILEDRPMEKVKEQLHISLGRAYQLRRGALKKLRSALEGEIVL